LFPQPVAYVDNYAMLSSFPKSGPFLSTYVFVLYQEAGKPVFRDLLSADRPAFLLMDGDRMREVMQRQGAGFRPEDREALRRYFRPTNASMLYLRADALAALTPEMRSKLSNFPDSTSLYAPFY